MKKTNKKGFTLIELIATILIIAILSVIAIPVVSKYIETSRRKTFVTNANIAIEAFRNDLISSLTTEDTTMTLAELNSIVEKPLIESPYGNEYENSSKLYVTFDEENIPTYSIVLYDTEGNGIFNNYGGVITPVDENDIDPSNVNRNIIGITTVMYSLPTVSNTAFGLSGGSISWYNSEIGGNIAVIPSSIGGTTITSIGSWAFMDDSLIAVVFPETITSINDQAFMNNNLTNIILPNSLTTMGFQVFNNNSLNSVTVGTGATTIDYGTFYKTATSNENLTKIINKTGRSFNWGLIVNNSTGYNFETGNVTNANGNVTVSEN